MKLWKAYLEEVGKIVPPEIRDLEDEYPLKVKLIDGDKVRNYSDIEFTMGGHHYVYSDMIPENEIWIDKDMVKEDRVSTLSHEFCERLLMKYYGFNYVDAHSISNKIEKIMRDAIPDK